MLYTRKAYTNLLCLAGVFVFVEAGARSARQPWETKDPHKKSTFAPDFADRKKYYHWNQRVILHNKMLRLFVLLEIIFKLCRGIECLLPTVWDGQKLTQWR